jgi:hypothetical protein
MDFARGCRILGNAAEFKTNGGKDLRQACANGGLQKSLDPERQRHFARDRSFKRAEFAGADHTSR